MRSGRASDGDAESIARVQERGWQIAYRHVFPVAELDRGGFIQVTRWRERLAGRRQAGRHSSSSATAT